MDNKTRTNRTNLTNEELDLLKTRIIETCKHNDTDFTINSKRLTDNINMLFGQTYSVDDVNFCLGFLYEQYFTNNNLIKERNNYFDI